METEKPLLVTDVIYQNEFILNWFNIKKKLELQLKINFNLKKHSKINK